MRVAGQRGVGEAGAQAVVEPPVELDEPGQQAGDALVALAVEVGRTVGRRLGVVGLVGRRCRRRPAPGADPPPAAASRRAWPSTHERTPAGAGGVGHLALAPT